MRRKVDPLHVASAVIAIAAIVVLFATTTSPSASTSRSGSVYDQGPGGAAALRRYLEAMGARTTTIQGGSFAPGDARVIFILGVSEGVSDADVAELRAFVRSGGTVVLATELGLLERSLLDAFGMRISGIAAGGTYPLATPVFADPPARAIAFDRGVALGVPGRADVLATDGRAPIVAAVREGEGLFVAAGSLWPFLAAGLDDADNARVVLALARPALAGGGVVAFDEYHHGVHPTSDVLVLLQETWPGRALVFAAIVTFLYLALSGRRLGPPLPLVVRPARSSLEYIRGFAGLVRRSGRGEIARRRMRSDLQRALAREIGVDPAMPFERVLGAVAASDADRAARARALDAALARPLQDDRLLRTVRDIEHLLAPRS